MYNDYTLYQAPSDQSQSPRTGNQWSQQSFSYGASNTNKSAMFQPRTNVSREFSKELQQRVQSHKDNMSNKSVDAIKRRFDGLANGPAPPPPACPSFNSSGNMYRGPPAQASNSNGNCMINTTLEESYWAQWKPQQSSSTSYSDNKSIKDPGSILKRSIAAFNRAARCGSPPPTSNEAPPPLVKVKDEKPLKVIRKPMEILESNSSEGDKINPMKLFGYNRMPADPPQPPCRPFVKSTPTIVMSVPPPYPGNYCAHINEQPQRDERFVMNMNEPRNCMNETRNCMNETRSCMDETRNCMNETRNCMNETRNCMNESRSCVNSIDDIKDHENEDAMGSQRCSGYASSKRSQSCDETKRPKPGKRRVEKYKNTQQTKSDEEVSDCFRDACTRNRVRFCTRKRCDDNDSNDSDSTPKDSSRTVDGYHGDIDTESYNQPKDCTYEFDNDSFEEGQGDLESDPFDTPRGSCGQSLSGNSLGRPIDTESFEDERQYERYPFFNGNRYYTQTYQCLIPDNNRSRQEDSGSESMSSKNDHDDSRSYNMYMDHSQVYGDQANYTRGVYDASSNVSNVRPPGNGYNNPGSYPNSDPSRCQCQSPLNCTCHSGSNSDHSGKHKAYVDSSKSTPTNEVPGRKGSGRMKVRSPREMDDISEKSYCTSKSNTFKDKSLSMQCCPCNEEETPPEEICEPCEPYIGDQNVRDIEPCLEPQSRNSLEPQSRNSLEPQSRNSLEPQSRNSLEPQSRNSLEPQSRNSLEPQSRNSLEPQSRISLELQSRNSLEPSMHTLDTYARPNDKGPDNGIEESHTNKTEECGGGESCCSISNDEMSNDCNCENNLSDEHLQQKESSCSTESCHCGYSSNDDIAVAESIKNIEEEAVPQKDSTDIIPNHKGSDDSLSIVAEIVYAVHNLQTDFEHGRYDASPRSGESMKVLHRNNQHMQARSSLSTDPSKTSQPPMMLQLSRSSRTATSTRSSYNKGHTYTLKSPKRKSVTRAPKQKR